jgi:hypothetical protein
MSTYGAERDIPNTYAKVPSGFTEGEATRADLVAAGFGHDPETDKPGQQPLSEMLVEGESTLVDGDVAAKILRESTFGALRDPEGKIVATWDEGRWWTPEESAEFTRQLGAELGGEAR